jgi:hypothetical protein
MKRPFPPAPAASDAEKTPLKRERLPLFIGKETLFPDPGKGAGQSSFLNPGILLFEKERQSIA